MLSRLRMPTDKAIRQYISLASAIFDKGNRKLAHQDGTFKATTLENAIKDLVAAKALGDRMVGPPPPTGHSNTDDTGCRAFVCAMPAHNMAHPQRFRTYAARAHAGPNCAIWQAARATTAAPTLFKRIAIAAERGHAPQEFVDGGVCCNNPARKVMEEARAVFGGATRLGCLVSIGAGHAGVIGLGRRPDAFERLLLIDLMRALHGVASDCENEAQRAARQFVNAPNKYFRFSVAHGAGDVALDEWTRVDELTAHTAAYLKDAAVSHAVDRLVKLLCEGRASGYPSGPEVTLDTLCTCASEIFTASGASSFSCTSMKRRLRILLISRY
jgi:predicted acylesterase/phospholipase RssA